MKTLSSVVSASIVVMGVATALGGPASAAAPAAERCSAEELCLWEGKDFTGRFLSLSLDDCQDVKGQVQSYHNRLSATVIVYQIIDGQPHVIRHIAADRSAGDAGLPADLRYCKE